jgi:type IV pilus assembly protein PilP
MVRNALVVAAVASLVGCGTPSSYDDLRGFVDDTLSKPRGRIEPIPVFKPYESFNYSAAGLRSPFELPVIIEESVDLQDRSPDLKPDLNRSKEYLEQFGFSELAMVGTLKLLDGDLWALVRGGDGSVVKIKEGNHLGQNYGRVISVSEYRMNVIEIVPNGMGGWIERPRTMVLEGLSGE